MLVVDFLFHERNNDEPVGFELGDISIIGDSGSVASTNSNQSMMLILSIVELLDGLRRFLSSTESRRYEFIGVDSSFSVVFCRENDGNISVNCDGQVIHTALPSSIKSDIQVSVLRFTNNNELARLMNSSEAADLQAALAAFQGFTPV